MRQIAAGIRLMTDVMAVRTRFFDDFFIEADRAGYRGRRSSWPPASTRGPTGCRGPTAPSSTRLDQPQVIAAKTAAMAAAGRRADRRSAARSPSTCATTGRRRCANSGFDAGAPSAWSAEGLLMYLPPDAQDRLFDNITALVGPRQPDGHRVPRRRLRRHARPSAPRTSPSAVAGQTASTSTSPICSTRANATTSSITSRERGWAVTPATGSTCSPTTAAHPVRRRLVPLRNSVAVTAIRRLGSNS